MILFEGEKDKSLCVEIVDEDRIRFSIDSTEMFLDERSTRMLGRALVAMTEKREKLP